VSPALQETTIMLYPNITEIARAGSALSAAHLSYCAAADEWSLWWPCATCGGATITLLSWLAATEIEAALASVAEHIRANPCPGCLSRRNRVEDTHGEPLAWYDTTLREWVVRITCVEGPGAIVPLEIRWYDAPHALVQAAAAQVVDDAI
jgi:hypothetical protein